MHATLRCDVDQMSIDCMKRSFRAYDYDHIHVFGTYIKSIKIQVSSENSTLFPTMQAIKCKMSMYESKFVTSTSC